ncbi:MAG: flagellar motor protein MotB [Pseudomonadota bacterium]|nr:flagellar motor protein MotB [Pseudomonadota bacterium]
MASDQKPPIIVRRRKRASAVHHGGAWKIAYADFVTAMMAFFLLMWLLGSTAKGDMQGISEYFKTPLKVAMAGGSGSGDSSSVIKGGGTDLSRSVGQRKQGDLPTEKRVVNIKAAEAERQREEIEQFKRLKQRVEAAVEKSAMLKSFKNQLRVDMTQDGLRIQIVDEQNRPMFDSGKAEVKDYTRIILREIGALLNNVPNRISLAGHTDSAPFAAGERGYSNWELSADRANASRRELIAGGIAEDKLIRVIGLGPSVPLNRDNPADAVNRRISIVIMNHKAEQRILQDGHGAADSVTPEALEPQAANSAPVRDGK